MKNILRTRPDDKLSGDQKFILEFVEKKDIVGKDVLDIGSGFGWFEYRIGKKCKSINGLEYNKNDVRMCQHFWRNSKKVVFTQGTALELPYEDNSFDTIVSWEVIEHIPKNTEERMFSEMERVLKKGGVIYLTTPYSFVLTNIFDPAWYFGHRHYSKTKMRELVKRTNKLKIVHMSAYGSVCSILYTINLYVAKWIFRRGPFFNEWFNRKIEEEYKKAGVYDLVLKIKKV